MPRSRMPASHLRLWLIDDTADHHATVRSTISRLPRVSFTGFLDAGEALATYARECDAQPPHLPEVVLMDYFLGPWRGDQVTVRLRELQPAAAALLIVGYSSAASGSARIVAAGGSLVLRKVRSPEGINPLLERFLVQQLALRDADHDP